jgi:CO/xanthine dehydrogenase FAD-binding subunit
MIGKNFAYLRPDTLEEAYSAFMEAQQKGMEVVYLNGGTETVTYARQNKIHPDLVIELFRLAPLKVLSEEENQYVYGSALTLNQIIEAKRFPLFERAAGIVDHTVRNKLSLGGNLLGRLPYRETVLPLLVSDARVRLYGAQGLRELPLEEVFDKRFRIKMGEILVDVRVPKTSTKGPHGYVRKTRLGSSVDYPIVTLCLVQRGSALRLATTGAFGYPLRSMEIEGLLNDQLSQATSSLYPRILSPETFTAIVKAASAEIVEDKRASAEYRTFLFKQALQEGLGALQTTASTKTTEHTR